jgi:hypothetical protein
MRAAAILVLLIAGCALPSPEPECDPAFEATALSCTTAVRESLNVLPDDHPSVTRVQALVGSVKPWECGGRPLASGESLICGYVVFTFADASREYVRLSLFNGHLAVASPAEY